MTFQETAVMTTAIGIPAVTHAKNSVCVKRVGTVPIARTVTDGIAEIVWLMLKHRTRKHAVNRKLGKNFCRLIELLLGKQVFAI